MAWDVIHMDKPMPKPTSTTFWGAGAALLAPCFLSPGAGQLRGTPTETQAAAGQRQVESALLRYCIVESSLMLKGWCTVRCKKQKLKSKSKWTKNASPMFGLLGKGLIYNQYMGKRHHLLQLKALTGPRLLPPAAGWRRSLLPCRWLAFWQLRDDVSRFQ